VLTPNTVMNEIAATDAPDRYLRSLHPTHEQFVRLRQALLKARGKDEDATKPTLGSALSPNQDFCGGVEFTVCFFTLGAIPS